MMPMLAPRRTPPCFTVSVVVLKMFMNETGPRRRRAWSAPSRRRAQLLEGEAVPPPVWWMMAASVAVFMMPAMESGTSRTKQAASCPEGLPALTRHGVLGTNSRRSMMPESAS